MERMHTTEIREWVCDRCGYAQPTAGGIVRDWVYLKKTASYPEMHVCQSCYKVVRNRVSQVQ